MTFEVRNKQNTDPFELIITRQKNLTYNRQQLEFIQTVFGGWRNVVLSSLQVVLLLRTLDTPHNESQTENYDGEGSRAQPYSCADGVFGKRFGCWRRRRLLRHIGIRRISKFRVALVTVAAAELCVVFCLQRTLIRKALGAFACFLET